MKRDLKGLSLNEHIHLSQFHCSRGVGFQIEKELHKINNKFHYIPLRYFDGSKRECFSYIEDLDYLIASKKILDYNSNALRFR